MMKSVTAYSVGATTRRARVTAPSIERALKTAVEGMHGREVRLLRRRMRMNLNEPPGSVFWPMTLRPVRLYVHSRETYATRRYQEVTHTGDAIEGMNHVRQREGAERKGS
jgi:hypothetical protein